MEETNERQHSNSDTGTSSNGVLVQNPEAGAEVTTVVDSADLGASKPVSQPKPTRKQIGEWRAANFTVKQGSVVACGHKFDPRTFPKQANCFDCWDAMFSSSPEGMASVHQLLLAEGTQAVLRMHGRKFLKFFGLFLRNKLLKEYQETQISSGIEGSVLDVKAESEASLGLR